MNELATIRRMVDAAVERLEAEKPGSPLRRLERSDLRRRLAVAAFNEVRSLQREIEAQSGPQE